MAYVPLTVLQLSLGLWKNAANQFAFNPISPSSAPVDVSGWYALTLFVFAQVNGENLQLGHIDMTGDAVFSSPTCTVSITNTQMASLNALPSGNYSYVLQGKPVSGDDYQAIIQGSMLLTAPDDSVPSP